ncbi:nucleotidyltransferase domain-containing protein [Candidatus Woesearchaeota archaeon]|nr:nucleotidyltransferase domain-containing protein [Candidatus Woesearchaeota archaeon]
MKELSQSNIVDYKAEGKNKVYFLKKTSETRKYVFMTENHKLIELLKKYSLLRKIIEKIQNNQKIKLAVIFGSYAKETAKHDSDIDIYVEASDQKIKSKLELIDSKINVKIGKYDRTNNLIKEIEKNHIIIKGVERFYEKNKFFD